MRAPGQDDLTDLAGETFRAEALRLEERLWGATGTKNRYHEGNRSPRETTEAPL